MRSRPARAFEDWTALLRSSFEAAGVAPERAGSLALMVESTIEGVLLMVRAYRDAAPARAVAAELAAAVEAALNGRNE